MQPAKSPPARIVQPSDDGSRHDRPSYTIATLVTNWSKYDTMRTSFASGGFSPADCEYIAIDNSAAYNTSAYQGLNVLLSEARGHRVILCHQDVRLLNDDRATLDDRLSDLDLLDPAWGLAGNAGGVSPGLLAIRITDPHGVDQHVGRLPARVRSLDENFIVLRNGARIGFSHDLAGFHLYGADICLMAEIAGYHAYVIDFHLSHLSGGVKGKAYREAEAAFRAKWGFALRPRWIQTPSNLVRVSGSRLGHAVGRVAQVLYEKWLRRIHGI